MNTDSNANPWETGSDELERYALEECIKRQRIDHRVSVMVIPAGRNELAGQFAQLGAHVMVVDHPDRQQDIEGRILAAGQRDQISFLPGSVHALPPDIQGEPFDIIVIRRGLCSLPYEEARKVVRQLLLKLRIGGKLYLSILGLHSELGESYQDADKPVSQRHAQLSSAIAGKYGLTQKVCLYSERDLFMLLLEAGGSVLRTMTTTYGSVKGIAVRV